MNPANGSIGVFDSGIGGLSVANAISRLLPRESVLYVADNGRAPYGPQSAAAILAYSREITAALLASGAKMIVVACNTATAIAIDTLRNEYPKVPFVGMEPAIKPAAEGNRIGVLATAATLGSERYLALKNRYLSEQEVLEDACIGLVPVIEAEAPGSLRLRERLKNILTPMIAKGIDTLVLGCTHYPMVQADIAAVCGQGVRIIDPSDAAAKQVARLLPYPFVGTSGRAHNFYCTGDSTSLQRALLGLPDLNVARALVVPNLKLKNHHDEG
ncbi:MAG: glutamate racemase [Bacteroidota bacterium]